MRGVDKEEICIGSANDGLGIDWNDLQMALVEGKCILVTILLTKANLIILRL
jgi:hypothetical protein